MQDLLNHIDELKHEWDSLQPLSSKNDLRLREKFRLEWNYNSNHIEGNTLSYGETAMLLRLGDDFRAQNNSLKDVREMQAHDTAIALIREWASNKERELTERDVRELNEIILVKPFYANAQTSDRQKTRRLITPGQYKSHPNHVELQSGEIFKYAEPEEVAPKMEELLTWYRGEDHELPPVVKAAYFHYKFVLIHPFDDGNGRVSRLLMNFHLMREGYPPAIIKSADKNNYLYALNQADTGNIEAFTKYIAEQSLWSLELAIKAGKGEPIEEKEDLQKEIEIFKKRQKTKGIKLIERNDQVSQRLYNEQINPLFKKIITKSQTFNELFNINQVEELTKIVSDSTTYPPTKSVIVRQFENTDTIREFKLVVGFEEPISQESPNRISHSLIVELRPSYYSLHINNGYTIQRPEYIRKSYKEILSETEIDIISNTFVKSLLNRMKKEL